MTNAATPTKRPAKKTPASSTRDAAHKKRGPLTRHTKKRRTTKSAPMAKTADRYRLYQRAVQDAEFEVKMLRRFYQGAFGKKAEPQVLREDFSGTGWVSCEWTTGGKRRESYAVDLDPTTHAWGRKHNLTALSPDEQRRVHWILGDVRDTRSTPKADIVAAMNFSYMIFKPRHELLKYFKAAHANLKTKGIFALDVFGGSEVLEDERQEVHRFKGFRYVWDQASHNPITGDYTFHIHFNFPDGSAINKAFTYDWRLWSLPELKDLLHEAGFSKVDVYWEDSDEDGDGTGTYRIRTRGDADLAWIAYLVAVK